MTGRADSEAAAPRGRSPRWSAILDLLATRGRLSVGEAADLLGVSEATIRRDFQELAARQLADRNHGGIVATSVAYELPSRYRRGASADDRARVGALAASLVAGVAVIALNGGTTTTEAARVLAGDADPSRGRTIVTNALNIATETVLRPHVRCITLGGVARPESYEVSGALAMSTLEQLWFDAVVFGVDAFDATRGATCSHDDEALVVRTMIERAGFSVCVAVGAKIGGRTLAAICPAESVTHLVTTADADPAELDRLRARGVRVHLA